MSTPAAAPAPRLPRGARRRQLLEAAARAFLAGGYDGSSMDDVAREAGVTRLILYRHFASKSELYGAVLDTMLADMGRRFDEASADDRRRDVAAVMLPVARAHPAAFRLLWRHAAHEPEFAEQAAFLNANVRAGARAAIAGAFTDPALEEWAVRTTGAHLMEGICTWLDVGDPDRDDELVAAMHRGLEALVAAWAG